MDDGEDRDPFAWQLALVFLATQLIVSLVAVFLVWFQGMSSAGCNDRCNYGLWYGSAVTFIAFAALAFVASAAAAVIWRRAPRLWIAPAVGSAAVIAGAVIAYLLGSIAFRV